MCNENLANGDVASITIFDLMQNLLYHHNDYLKLSITTSRTVMLTFYRLRHDNDPLAYNQIECFMLLLSTIVLGMDAWA